MDSLTRALELLTSADAELKDVRATLRDPWSDRGLALDSIRKSLATARIDLLGLIANQIRENTP